MFVPTLLLSSAVLAALASGSPSLLRHRTGLDSGDQQQQQSGLSSTIIETICPGCGFFVGDKPPFEWIEKVESALSFNFTAIEDKMLFNGRIFYPLGPNAGEVLQAPLIRIFENDSLPHQTIPVNLGYTLGSDPANDLTMARVKFHVLEIAGRRIDGINPLPVKMWLKRDDEGRGIITAYSIGPFQVDDTHGPLLGGSENGGCQGSFCHLRFLLGIAGGITLLALILRVGFTLVTFWKGWVASKRRGQVILLQEQQQQQQSEVVIIKSNYKDDLLA